MIPESSNFLALDTDVDYNLKTAGNYSDFYIILSAITIAGLAFAGYKC